MLISDLHLSKSDRPHISLKKVLSKMIRKVRLQDGYTLVTKTYKKGANMLISDLYLSKSDRPHIVDLFQSSSETLDS